MLKAHLGENTQLVEYEQETCWAPVKAFGFTRLANGEARIRQAVFGMWWPKIQPGGKEVVLSHHLIHLISNTMSLGTALVLAEKA